jgi:hypothetical protein
VSGSQQEAVFTEVKLAITMAFRGSWPNPPGDPMIVFLISASILTLVAVSFISGVGTSQGRRA